MSGLFFSLDGIDGCGKSTQITMLSEWLRARSLEFELVRDPGGTPLGESLREILLHRSEIPLDTRAEMLLYMASRAQLVSQIIRPALAAGKTILSDRYLLANVVYQGSGGGLPSEDIWNVGKIATDGLLPDLTIVLDLAPELAFQRLTTEPDRLESRGLEYMRRVRDGFLAEAKRLAPQVAIVDANRPKQEIQAELQTILGPYFH